MEFDLSSAGVELEAIGMRRQVRHYTESMSGERLGAVVLCGGQSRRMGFPKAWLAVDGERLLPRMTRMLMTVASEVVAAAARRQRLPPLPPAVAVIRDPTPNQGPLAGMAAAFDRLQSEIVFVAACDLPGLSAETVQAIVHGFPPECDAVVPIVEGRVQPLAAAYRRNLRWLMNDQLAKGQASLQAFLGRIRWQPITDLPPQAFRNLNHPFELADFEQNHAP